jgi:pimeloyl-ACP methyl ester carboxylesterase
MKAPDELLHESKETEHMPRHCSLSSGIRLPRFLSEKTLRSGQQAVLAHDLVALLDAVDISQATLAGDDSGGPAACIVAALFPERVKRLASQGRYNIQDIRDRRSLGRPRRNIAVGTNIAFSRSVGAKGSKKIAVEFCRLLWRLWPPVGISTMRLTNARRSHSIILTLLPGNPFLAASVLVSSQGIR